MLSATFFQKALGSPDESSGAEVTLRRGSSWRRLKDRLAKAGDGSAGPVRNCYTMDMGMGNGGA